MGNRLSSGSTGDFGVEVFVVDVDSAAGGGEDGLSPVSVGEAVYTGGGEYAGAYNVTIAGDYTLHVRSMPQIWNVTRISTDQRRSGPLISADNLC